MLGVILNVMVLKENDMLSGLDVVTGGSGVE